MGFEDEIKLFEQEDIEISNTVKIEPEQCTYIYQYNDDKCKKSWRSDGYRFREDKKKVYVDADGGSGEKYYFKLRIAQGESAASFTNRFKKTALTNSRFPGKVLLTYTGDPTVAVGVPHAKAKDQNRPMVYKNPTISSEIKERCRENPSDVYQDLKNREQDPKRHIVDTPRDLKQVTNFQEAARRDNDISTDLVKSIVEIHGETKFVIDYHLIPSFTFSLMLKGKKCSFIVVTFKCRQMLKCSDLCNHGGRRRYRNPSNCHR